MDLSGLRSSCQKGAFLFWRLQGRTFPCLFHLVEATHFPCLMNPFSIFKINTGLWGLKRNNTFSLTFKVLVRLLTEEQDKIKFLIHVHGIHRHEKYGNFKDWQRRYIRHLGQRKKQVGVKGNGVLDFRSENELFIGSEEEWNTNDRQIFARQLLDTWGI